MLSQPSPRRVKSSVAFTFGRRAVGRRYEIGYQGSDGRWRWRVVEGGLKEARAARAEVVAKLARGEQVAPARVTFGGLADAWLAGEGADRAQDSRAVRRDSPRSPQAAPRARPPRGRDGRRRARPDRRHGAGCVGGDGAEGGARCGRRPLPRCQARRNRAQPVRRLERGERPTVERREMRTLDREEIASLLAASRPLYRPLLATAVFTGLRLGELLGLTWHDVDFETGFVRVRKQLGATGNGSSRRRRRPCARSCSCPLSRPSSASTG